MKTLIEKITKLDIDSILKSLGFVYSYSKRHIKGVILYTLLSLSGVLTGFLSSLVSKDLVDIVTGQRAGELLRYFVTMILVTLINMAVTQIANYFSLKISLAINTDIRSDIFTKMLDADWQRLSEYHSGDLLSRVNGDTSTISSGALSFIPGVITSLAQFVGALAMVIWYDWTFAVFALIGTPFSIIISRMMVGRMQANTLGSAKKSAENYAITQEAFSNIGFVKAFDLLKMYDCKFKDSLIEYNRMKIDYNRMSIVSTIIISLAGMLVTYSSYGWGVYRVWSGVISYGTMTMFLSLSGTLSSSVNSLGSQLSMAVSIDTSARRVLEILDMPKDDFKDEKTATYLLSRIRTADFSLEFHNASFKYRDSDEEVFHDINIEMKKGQVYAIVGPSGDGKTTFVRCLLSLIKPTDGEACIVSGDYRLGLSASTRKFFSIVPQKSTMFSGSVRDNLLTADEDAGDNDMIEALKEACAWDFVAERGGLDSQVLEGGGGFSSGQIQRIAIARALLRNAPILVLDEATSALDTETEDKVIANIMKDRDKRLTIVTTHRPAILKYCDEIYRFQGENLKKC